MIPLNHGANGALLPYSDYKPSGIPWLGDVPTHWDVRQLRNVLTGINMRNQPDQPLLSVVRERGVILRDVNDLEENHNFIPDDLTNYKVVKDGQFAMNKMKAWQGSYGVSQHDGIVSPAYFVFDLQDVDGGYFHTAIRSRAYVAFFAQASDGVRIGQWDLSQSRMREIPFLLPPLPEQRAIVRYLDYVDRRIRRYVAAKRKLTALLEEERKNATFEAIQSPDARSFRLGAVADLAARPIKRAGGKTYTPIGLYNRGRGMFRKEPRSVNELGDSSFFWVKEGDLVISGQFAWEGAIALAGGIEDGCVASHRYPILRGKPGVLDSGFLLSFFQTAWGQLLLDHHSRGAAGRNRPLNIRTLLKEAISLPPLESQSRISGMLQRESYIRQQARALEQLLTEYRTRLVADVVTGKLDVREAAAYLPDEADDHEPIGEGDPQQNGLAEDIHDIEESTQELAIESEVTA